MILNAHSSKHSRVDNLMDKACQWNVLGWKGIGYLRLNIFKELTHNSSDLQNRLAIDASGKLETQSKHCDKRKLSTGIYGKSSIQFPV